MSEKNKRAEELLFGKARMTFAEIMQSMEACAKINCEKCALHAIIDGWSQGDLPDCSTVLMKNASDTLLEYYNKLRTPEPAVNAKAEKRHEGWTTEDTVGGRFGYFFSRARKEELRREESSEENRKVWRWDDIFQVFRCPVCGRPEKPSMKLRTKSGVQYILPQKCGYCGAQMEGVEAK